MFSPGPPRDRLELSERFRAGELEVDRAAMRAILAGRALTLEPKAFDLLLLLAANCGRVVTKDEIFERVWPGVIVSDNSLTRPSRSCAASSGTIPRRRATSRRCGRAATGSCRRRRRSRPKGRRRRPQSRRPTPTFSTARRTSPIAARARRMGLATGADVSL